MAAAGAAMGLITSLVGLKKGHEVYAWLVVYASMGVSVVLVGVADPFWTLLTGGVAAGLVAGMVQSALMRPYRRHNPWYAKEMDRPALRVAGSFIAFGVVLGGIFGLVAGGVGLALSLV